MDNNKYSLSTDEKDKNIDINVEGKDKELKDIKIELKIENVKRTVYDENAPYDNTTVGVAGVFFGPIAGGILSYISLKNLGNKYAKYVLIGSFLITIIVSYILIFIIPNTSNLELGFLWLIFMSFQQAKVKKWGEENLDKKYKSGFKALLWGFIGFILFFVISFLVALIFDNSPSTAVIENSINVSKNYPNEVKVGDTFNIEFTINNKDKISHELNSIDFDSSFLEGVSILNTSPNYIKENPILLGMGKSFEFKKDLSIGQDNKIIFIAEALKKGDFSDELGFCIDAEDTCIFKGLNIVVN